MSGGVEAALRQLESAIEQAIESGQLKEDFKWSAAIDIPGRPPWMILMTVAEVLTKAEQLARDGEKQ